MANPKDIKKQNDPSSSFEEIKKQAASYEELKKKVPSEFKKENDPYEDLEKQIRTSYPDEITYSTTLKTLREKLIMMASTNSDLHDIAEGITVITFFENQQAKQLAELKKESQNSSALNFDNQSLLQTSSVRKKEPKALELVPREPELQKSKHS